MFRIFAFLSRTPFWVKVVAFMLVLPAVWWLAWQGPLMRLGDPEGSDHIFAREWTVFGFCWFGLGILLVLAPPVLAWLHRREGKGWIVVLIVVVGIPQIFIVGMSLLLDVKFVVPLRPDCSDRDREIALEMLRRSEPLVAKFQQHHRTTGTYPDALHGTANPDNPWSNWRGWEYVPQDDFKEAGVLMKLERRHSTLSLWFDRDGAVEASYHGLDSTLSLRTWKPLD
jgi:hypothetical protein